MAEAMRIVLNKARRAERGQAPKAGRCQRSDRRRGYANVTEVMQQMCGLEVSSTQVSRGVMCVLASLRIRAPHLLRNNKNRAEVT